MCQTEKGRRVFQAKSSKTPNFCFLLLLHDFAFSSVTVTTKVVEHENMPQIHATTCSDVSCTVFHIPWGVGASADNNEIIVCSHIVKEVCANVCLLPCKQKRASEGFQQEIGILR